MAIQADKTIRLPDGRTLGYAEAGDTAGTPVLHFHGSPSCRLDVMAAEFDSIAERLGVRLLAIDRPGMGLSDPKSGRTILDWPADVLAFADALGLSRFSALGLSGGGPYAAACAVRIPHRLRSVGMVCGVAPADVAEARVGIGHQARRLRFLARWFPWALRRGLRTMATMAATQPTSFFTRFAAELPDVDHEAIGSAARRTHVIGVMREAFRRGEEGVLVDLRLTSHGWGFQLSQIPIVMNLWFAGKDVYVPPAAGRYLAAALPRSEARFYPNEGHVSILFNRFEEVLAGLLATARREDGRPVRI
jgi:pimeloyl-ACP methyl ester carboxylesterase